MAEQAPLNDRVPFMRQSAPQYQGKDGKMIRPLAFLHPCRFPGCEREGCYGFGVRLLSKDVKNARPLVLPGAQGLLNELGAGSSA